MARSTSRGSVHRDGGLAGRFEQAFDLLEEVPPYNFGRLKWVQQRLIDDHGVKVSQETIRKWINGEARPRPSRMAALARVLKVEQAWLFFGESPNKTAGTAANLSRSVDGSICYVAGVIGLAGGSFAFPEANDPNKDLVHLHVIFGGVLRSFHIATGKQAGTIVNFMLPQNVTRTWVIGLIKRGGYHHDLFRLDLALIEQCAIESGSQWKLSAEVSGRALQIGGRQIEPVHSPAEIVGD